MNLKTILLAIIPLLSALSCTTTPKPAIEKDAQIEQMIAEQLKRMTLEEKVGQMSQITVDVLCGESGKEDFILDEEMLDKVFGHYKVGSILNVAATTARDRETWNRVIAQIQERSLTEIGIPCIYGVDQIHGTTYTLDGTLFPQGVNMAATFNRDLVELSSQISAYETRASQVPWTFAPVMDLCRDPRWPRMWESYGEDAYVNSEMGAASIAGFQGEDPNNVGRYNVAACAKHYMGYGVPVSGKDRTPSSITDVDMRERYFAPFLNAIRSGVLTVMVNSGINNGLPFHANYEYLTQWLKEDLNWDGLIVTDWADINNLHVRDHIVATPKEAVKVAINAGIDMAMIPYDLSFCDHLIELVKDGEVPISRIDDAVSRVLRLKYRLGLFEKPLWQGEEYEEFASEESAKVALQAAEESITLLKNDDDVLPLKKGAKILLSGPNSNSMRSLNGGWSYSWQGDKTEQFAGAYNTIYEAMCDKFGKENIIYEEGVSYSKEPNAKWWEEQEPRIERAVAAARGADVIVVCVGENSYCETPGNLTDLNLSQNQKDLVEALSKSGKPIVMVLNEGRARIIREIVPLSDAIVHTYLPSNYGADALVNLLAKDANFSGKLPFTYPRYINSLATYDYKYCENMGQMGGNYNYDSVMDVEWVFGHGLSYTNFEYSNLSVDKSRFTSDDELTFSVDVTNTGDMAGKESVLLFVSDLVASITPDNQRLRAFEKVAIQPGETVNVVLKIKGSDLAFVGYDNGWVLEKGEFKVRCGSQTLRIECVEDKKWTTPNI